MNHRVCSRCGTTCAVDVRGGSVDHYLVCDCDNPRYRIPGSYGGSRSDTYDGNVFNARPVTVEQFHRERSRPDPQRWDREDD